MRDSLIFITIIVVLFHNSRRIARAKVIRFNRMLSSVMQQNADKNANKTYFCCVINDIRIHSPNVGSHIIKNAALCIQFEEYVYMNSKLIRMYMTVFSAQHKNMRIIFNLYIYRNLRFA